VYIARCADGSLYTGIALDVMARLAAHDAGRGARYTRGRGPLALCAKRRCRTKTEALRLELAVKRLPRARKEALTSPRRLDAFARAARSARARDPGERAHPRSRTTVTPRGPSTQMRKPENFGR